MNEHFDATDAPATESLDLDKLQVKVAACPTCKGWVFVSAFPQCETSKDSKKEFRACLDAGLNINVVTLREAHVLACCPTRGRCKPGQGNLPL